MSTHQFSYQRTCCALLLAGLSMPVCAQGIPQNCDNIPGVDTIRHYPGIYNFYYENDLLNSTDNNYTSGVKVSWLSSNLGS